MLEEEFSELTASSCSCKIYLNIQSEARAGSFQPVTEYGKFTEHWIFLPNAECICWQVCVGISHWTSQNLIRATHSLKFSLATHSSFPSPFTWVRPASWYERSHGYSSSVCPLLFIGLTVNKILTLLNPSLWWFPRGFQTHMITCKYMGGYIGGLKNIIEASCIPRNRGNRCSDELICHNLAH